MANAGDRALASGATNPSALRTFVELGVTVASSPRLHGKVVVAGRWVITGSANASASSDTLAEAAIVTNDPRIREAARHFISTVPGTTPVDAAFLAAAQAIWQPPIGSPRPGADGTPTEDEFLPPNPRRMWLETDVELYEPGADEIAVAATASRRKRRHAGPAATYRLDTRSSTDAPWRRGTIIIEVYDDRHGDRVVGPPLIVISDPISVRGVRHTISIVRYRTSDEPVPVEAVHAAARHEGTRLSLARSRFVRSTAAQAVLLAAWDLN